ncbi:hypothetical protein [Candidatus Albibeggiatoa sp. nov. BB20]|uniref:hypothetical protein n=1 Tax=Candidatus Albibeggiatoa sp. nov. BB20 TaxID=3162723 RepID=UPI00336531E9
MRGASQFKLQRFFRNYGLDMDGIAELIGSWLPAGGQGDGYYLDRTHWQKGMYK